MYSSVAAWSKSLLKRPVILHLTVYEVKLNSVRPHEFKSLNDHKKTTFLKDNARSLIN